MYKENTQKKLKEIRKQQGYTQQEVANETGISRSTIAKIECGTNEPSLDTLGTLIDFYEVSANWVLGTGKTIE